MTEDDAIRQAVPKYEAKGYEIEFGPPADALPEGLRGRRPAFLARKGRQTVLVEVWDWTRLVELPPKVMPPGWYYDALALPRPQTESVISGADATPAFTRRLLAELDRLPATDAAAARFLIAWSAAEAAMRVAAERNGLKANYVPPRALVSDLTAEGVLSYDHEHRLYELLAARNHLYHGSPTDPPPAADVDFLAGLARELLAADAIAAA